MSYLRKRIERACKELDLKVEFDRDVNLSDGVVLRPDAYLPCLGGARGILVFARYSDLKPHDHTAWSAGFAYSVLNDDPPLTPFDIDVYIDMFSEWGWHGDPNLKPAWMLSDEELWKRFPPDD